MARDFDIVIIGSGVIGAACALVASLNQNKVLLLDKSDFGASTSASSFKIIHGGLRYIQHLDFKRIKESYQEQRFMRLAAPHMIRPLPFLVPCYGYGIKGTLALRTACSLYEVLSSLRNEGVSDSLKLPNHKTFSREEVLKIAPRVATEGLKGGVAFYDAQMLCSERLTLAFISEAKKNGAEVRNYNEVIEIRTSLSNAGKSNISEILVRDSISGSRFQVSPKVVINAMGPGISRISELFSESLVKANKDELSINKHFLSKGIQLVLPEIISNYAVSVESRGADTASSLSRGGRAYFLQPWHGRTLIGTTDSIYEGDPEEFRISSSEVSQFLSEVYQAYPSEKLKLENVLHAYGGLRLVDSNVQRELLSGVDREGMNNTSRKEDFIDHSQREALGLKKIENLITIGGIKYTTARAVAEKTINTINNRAYLGKSFKIKEGLSEKVRFYENLDDLDPSKVLKKIDKSKSNFSLKQIESLIMLYGSSALSVLESAVCKERNVNISPDRLLLYAQVEFAIKSEYAKTLSDIISRRLELSGVGLPKEDLINEISLYAQEFLGWDDNQRIEEIEKFSEKFKLY